MAALVLGLPNVAAPPPPPQANPPSTTPYINHITKTLAFLFLLFISTATMTGTYFSARALSGPWQDSQTPVLVALLPLLILDLYALSYLIAVTLFISSARAARYIDAYLNKASDAVFFASLFVLHVALTVAMVTATYFAARELKARPRVEPGLVVALMLLGPLDVLLVAGLSVFMGCGLVEVFDVKGRAKGRWRNLGAVGMPERTREEALESVRRELEMGV